MFKKIEGNQDESHRKKNENLRIATNDAKSASGDHINRKQKKQHENRGTGLLHNPILNQKGHAMID
ncbi:hypothetical protein D3C85_1775660 [compost metagenome]